MSPTERSIASYLKAVSGIFEQTFLFFQSVKVPKGFDGEIEDSKGDDPTSNLISTYTRGIDFFTRQAEAEVADWDRSCLYRTRSESFYVQHQPLC